MPAMLPYRYDAMQQDDMDPYSRRAGGGGPQATQPLNDAPARRPMPAPSPTSQSVAPVVPQTFAQMQAAGVARPPMPSPSSAPMPSRGGASMMADPNAPTTAVPRDWHTAQTALSDHIRNPGGAPTTVKPFDGVLKEGGSLAGQSPTDLLLQQLLTGAQGQDWQKLFESSPYNSKAVKDQYSWLAGNIDDQFATDERNLDSSMAARGLYGSAGKDFHSGRLSDLNVGRRTAKEGLAQDLAHQYASSAGNWAMGANNAQMGWVNQLMGYGQNAFNNDLSTAEFNHEQDMDYQRLLEEMNRAGYGG